MSNPIDNVGKIVKSLEKYFDVRQGRIRVKSRPSLIIGFETHYTSLLDIDYELLPISTLANQTPDDTYDYPVSGDLVNHLGLDRASYIRTHKITWNHIKHMEITPPIGDLKAFDPELFNRILLLNEQWVTTRTRSNIVRPAEESTR